MSSMHAFDGSEIDGGILRSIVNFAHSTPWLQGFFLFLSHGELIILFVLLVIAWYMARKNPPHNSRDFSSVETSRSLRLARVYALPVIIVGSYIINFILKHIVHELRPCRSMHDPYIAECPHDMHNYAFPSSHAILAMSCAIGLYWINKRLSLIAVIIAVLISFSRLYLGAHYPHDVLVGALLGGMIAYLFTPKIAEIVLRIEQKSHSKLSQ